MHTLKNDTVYVAFYLSASQYGALVRVTPEPPLRLTPCDSDAAIHRLVFGVWPSAITVPYGDIMCPVSKLPTRITSMRDRIHDDVRWHRSRQQGGV